ncbi:MAG: sugar phosphate nucleotidyltransferase [Patescibacteria group bacterium]
MKTNIILAAGFGKRTQGTLQNTPKCLVKTGDAKTILDHLITDLHQIHKESQIIIITNTHYYDCISACVSLYQGYIKVINNRKKTPEERLGALGDLKLVFDRYTSIEEALVIPSDTTYWHSFLLKDFISFSVLYPDDFMTICRDVKDKNIIKKRFGCPIVKSDNRITSFVEKPARPGSTYAATPFYIYRKKHIRLLSAYLRQGGNPDSPGMIIPYLLKHGQTVRAFVVNDRIIDVGTPEDIERARDY